MSNDKSAATYHQGDPPSWWRQLVKRVSAWVIHLVARLQQRGQR